MARKSFVLYDYWIDALDTIADPADRWMLVKWVKTYATTGEEEELPEHLVPLAMMIKPSVDENNGKYDETIARRKKAAEKSWEKRRTNVEAGASDDENKQKTMEKTKKNDAKQCKVMQCNEVQCYNDNVYDNVYEDLKSKDLKSLPPTPQGEKEAAEAAEGGIEKFGLYQESVEKALANIPPEVAECYEDQYAWRLSEGMPGYALAVKQAIASGKTGYALEEQIRLLNGRYPPRTEFQAYKTAKAIASLSSEDAKLAVHEINQSMGEPGLWKTMQEKIAYIKTRRKEIRNVAAFLHSRQPKPPK